MSGADITPLISAGASSRRRGGGDLGAPTSLFPFLLKVGDPDVPCESALILCKSTAGVSALLQERRSLAESWDMAVEDTEAARRWVQNTMLAGTDVTAWVGAAGGQGGDDQGIDNVLITGGGWQENEPQNGCVTSSDHIIQQAVTRQNLDRGPQSVTAGQGMSGGAGKTWAMTDPGGSSRGVW